MDLKKYDELRKKINTKDFEGKNKDLDKWLFRFSFIGNISSIFFAYFLVYPALLKAITSNFLQGRWGIGIAFSLTIIFLSIFEITKRYVIRNFSNDFIANKKKINFKILGWSIITFSLIILSFYLSISGSKKLATTTTFQNIVVNNKINKKVDSLNIVFAQKKKILIDDNNKLREINNTIRKKYVETPLNYRTVRNDYQKSIDKNTKIIQDNENQLKALDNKLSSEIIQIKNDFNYIKNNYKKEENKNILLFIIIVIFNELIIVSGVYFREYFEYTLFIINQEKFEKIYQKKDRYKALLNFIYRSGKLTVGDKVISGMDLKAIVSEKTTIPNPNKFVEEFLRDMDRLGIFVTHGKRRYIGFLYNEALDVVENYDDAYRVLENLK